MSRFLGPTLEANSLHGCLFIRKQLTAIDEQKHNFAHKNCGRDISWLRFAARRGHKQGIVARHTKPITALQYNNKGAFSRPKAIAGSVILETCIRFRTMRYPSRKFLNIAGGIAYVWEHLEKNVKQIYAVSSNFSISPLITGHHNNVGSRIH